MYGLFYRIALNLYKWTCIHKIYLPSNRQVEKDLEKLYPGENRQQLCTEYYVRKLAKSIIICVVGIFFAIVLTVQAKGKLVLNEAGELVRGGYGEASEEVEVECVLDDTVQNFTIEMAAQRYDEETIKGLYEEFCIELAGYILGNNASLEEVTEDLCLLEVYEGYPFLVEWQSADTDLVHNNGTVERENDVVQVTKLTAKISYGDWSWEEQFHIAVLPMQLTEEEQLHKEIEMLLQKAEQSSRTEKTMKLPEHWNEQELIWKEKTENYSWSVLLAGVMVAILVYALADKDLHDTVEKRKQEMKKDYPNVVHKLTLYLGAGMTIRGSFLKMAEEYKAARKEGRKECPVYEEILHMCREMKAGVSEGATYEHFGKRTGLQEYIRLCTLLMQNLKKGNNTLLQRLKEEAQKASVEQIQYGKRLCEEAVTKLLLPMVFMLLVVMLIIMIPAFSTMGV